MNIKAALLLAFRNLGHFNKKGDNQLKGSIIGIAISLIPILVVIVVSNGMIEGITNRLIEVFTYHIQIPLISSLDHIDETIAELKELDFIKNAHYERSGHTLAKSENGSSAALVKSIPREVLVEDEQFRENFNLLEGEHYLETVPRFIKTEIFQQRFLSRARTVEAKALLKKVYKPDETGLLYVLDPPADAVTGENLLKIIKSLKYSTVILGKALGELLKAEIGDQIYLLSVKNIKGKRIARSSKYIISGIFATGYQDVDRFLLYISLEQGRKILADDNAKQYIGIKVHNPFEITAGQKKDVAAVLDNNNINHGMIRTWLVTQRNRILSYKMTRVLLLFIMGLIILVASVNVSTSMVMLVMGKNREIAILKSMGTSPSTISFVYLFTGMCTGLIGTVCGLVPGLIIAVNVNEIMVFIERMMNVFLNFISGVLSPLMDVSNIKPVKILNPDFYIEHIPIRISFWEVFGVACFSLFVATMASYIPAKRAGEIKPLEIIRKY